MLVVSTLQVIPPSEVLRPDEVASLMASVSPKDESAAFKISVVERYSTSINFGISEGLNGDSPCAAVVAVQESSWHSTAVPHP